MQPPRPVLLVDDDLTLLILVQRLLANEDRPRPLLLLPQHPQVRQFLRDSVERGRTPAVMIVRANSAAATDPAEALLQWLREQDRSLSTIPVVLLTEGRAAVIDAGLTLVADSARPDHVAVCVTTALLRDAS